MTFDICPHCDGSGERCILSGAKCYECNGTGVIEDCDPDEEEFLDESYERDLEQFNAIEKPPGLYYLGGGDFLAVD